VPYTGRRIAYFTIRRPDRIQTSVHQRFFTFNQIDSSLRKWKSWLKEIPSTVSGITEMKEECDPMKRQQGLARAVEKLELAYAWLEGQLASRTWAAGANFTLADCAAAPPLFYADWTHRISEAFPVLRAYRARLLARPSFTRAVEEARSFRPNFPLGAPDRD
jgi:glutathione S-transferase